MKMSISSKDKTLERNYLQNWQRLISEYELIKKNEHPKYKKVGDFYKENGITRQTFLKYLHRYLQSGENESGLLPQKRGPKWASRRPIPEIEEKVVNERKKGINRYEIYDILKPILKEQTPSPSGIYNICKRHELNRLNVKMKEEKRRIIKERAGELGHIDCHYLSKALITGKNKRYYLVCIVDSCTRIAWAEVLEDIKSLSVMFATLKILNYVNQTYHIRYEEVLTDNGAEFKGIKTKESHPFERMLMELGIKHRYTKAYRPQTNGKVERFWRTIEDEMIEGTTFESIEEFKEELMKYMIYYNEYRSHQGLGGEKPKVFLENLATN